MKVSVALLLELGVILAALSLFGALARRFALSPIPLYLLAGLALGEGGIAPVPAAGPFVETGAGIGVVLLLLVLGLEFTVPEFTISLRRHLPSAVVDLVLNAAPGAVAGWLLGLDAGAILALAGVTYISSSGIIARLLGDLRRLGNRESPAVLSVLVLEDFLPIASVDVPSQFTPTPWHEWPSASAPGPSSLPPPPTRSPPSCPTRPPPPAPGSGPNRPAPPAPGAPSPSPSPTPGTCPWATRRSAPASSSSAKQRMPPELTADIRSTISKGSMLMGIVTQTTPAPPETASDFGSQVQYSLTTVPDPLTVSPAEGTVELGDLVIVASRIAVDPIETNEIAVYLPVGSEAWQLVLDYTGMQVPAPSGWTATPGEANERILFKPDSEHATIGPERGLTLQLNKLRINRQIGTAPIGIELSWRKPGNSAWKTENQTLDIGKFPADFYLRNLKPDRAYIDNGDTVTLTWERPEGTGATYHLLYENTEIEVTGYSTFPVQDIRRNTMFYLRGRIQQGTGTAERTLSTYVTVNKPDMEVSDLGVHGKQT
ncbi:TRAP transporter membrane protein [Streptomyces sp. NBRC 110611]|nr:TRAP transporter membrane protein [Streptomyces sp. NBRC 110611]